MLWDVNSSVGTLVFGAVSLSIGTVGLFLKAFKKMFHVPGRTNGVDWVPSSRPLCVSLSVAVSVSLSASVSLF